jgi:hypothetical protein
MYRLPEAALHLTKKRAQCRRSSGEFRRALPYRRKVGFDRSRARKAEGPMTDCRVAAGYRFRRPGHVPLAYDLLQPDPKCILEAQARFVAGDHDRALDDRRFHEDTPPFALNSTAQPFPLRRAFRAARIAHQSNIREWYCDQVPRPNTRPVNIKFLEWFRRDCDFRSTRSQIGWQCDRFATYRAASRTGRTP